MTTLTLFFAGSGHGMSSDDDSLVTAYHRVQGPKAFFPGPGGKDANIYTSQHYQAVENSLAAKRRVSFEEEDGIQNVIGQNYKESWGPASAGKRAATGKGWNRNVWYALRLIADYLEAEGHRPLRLNIAGHSRGSITIMMMLNDIFYQSIGSADFRVASTVKGTKTFTGRPDDFNDWYLKRIRKIYNSRMDGGHFHNGSGQGDEAVANIGRINANMNSLEEINVFMFDPVAGKNQGGTNRKQNFPEHPKINKVRVLRMEHGNAGLSTHMPTFPGWTFLNGAHERDLDLHLNGERLVIPLPGSHGAGLSTNKGTTTYERKIGTHYMARFLEDSGTDFGSTAGLISPRVMIYFAYQRLFSEYDSKSVGNTSLNTGATRRDIHMSNRHAATGGYLYGVVNGHHAHLRRNARG